MTKKQPARKKRKGVSAAGARKAKPPKRKSAARRSGTPARKTRFAKVPGLPGAGGFQRFFPKILSTKTGTGEGALLAVAIRSETGLEVRTVALEQVTGATGRGHKRKRGAICPNTRETARLLRGLAHAERLHILEAMRQGARKHIEIKVAVKLAAGPLYHHLRELERSGLIECPSRNDYALTGSGRSALLLVSGLNALAAKSRRTAPWKAKSYRKRPAKPVRSKVR